jgi:hypothetical protein
MSNREFVSSLTDLHVSVQANPKTDWGADEFRARARGMVERFEHQVRAAGTMDKSTFLKAFSWFFYMARPDTTLHYMRESDCKRIEFRCEVTDRGLRRVVFLRSRRAMGRAHTYTVSAEEAAEIFWSFLQDEDVPESFNI